ncbi:helix-turn-helix transcriptional regulator [Hyphobacterium sp. CCMP332]|uniref:helix-turn-helix domain-containing protein n=1 Tax=Hyphobacterium sp. CCMP332 TaxID=2749086 RepID=UPI00164FF469|nr:helix-turn-helix transcriptional regulator [Hyphobacterium sp. CCMP332]QNL19296.1 helix-turn-helix transcriptional regulator [Hyphobacterium sp. CCMP332]
MQTDGVLLLSALVTGIALAGALAVAVTGARQNSAKSSRIYLLSVFVTMAGLCALPLATAVQPALFTFYTPALLPLMFALPVAVYRYAQSRLTGTAEPQNWQRDAVLPLAGLGVMLGYWMLPASARRDLFINGDLPGGIAPAALTLLTFALIFVWVAASILYLIATLRTLARYRATLKSLYSNTEAFELRWIDGFLILLVGVWAAAAISLLSDNLGIGFLTPDTLVFALAGGVLLTLTAFANAPVPPNALNLPTSPSGDPATEKYARSALSTERAEKIAERILKAMETEKLYLDPGLSLQKLARHVTTPPNLVSQTLNEQLGMTFFDFVAQWRVEDAKSRILAGDDSVLNIALDVGFNSRSTFYKAFKRETGQTPKEFRRMPGASTSMASTEHAGQ